MTAKADPDLVTYEVEVERQAFIVARRGAVDVSTRVFRFDIPRTWTLTYGPLVPHSSRNDIASDMVLRVYEGKSCRMLLRDVRSFRALNFQMWEKDGGDWVNVELREVEA